MSTIIIKSCLCQEYTHQEISEVFSVMQSKKGNNDKVQLGSKTKS